MLLHRILAVNIFALAVLAGHAVGVPVRLLEAARHRDTRMTWSDRLDTFRRDVAYAARQLRSAAFTDIDSLRLWQSVRHTAGT